MSGILTAIASVGLMGLAFGAILGVASKLFAVKTDERETKILEALPGANCGGCGYAGCSAYAAAVASGEARPNKCPVGGRKVANELSSIMGIEAVPFEHQVAKVFCQGEKDKSPDKFEYAGIMDCYSASKFGTGPKGCAYGCIGLGSCVKECAFGALSVEDGVARVDKELCTACGKCVNACPKNLIHLVPYDQKYLVLCSSHDKGAQTRKVCNAGCIACKICEKNCPENAIKVVDNVAVIDYSLCKNCGICAEKCPRNIIKLV